VFPLFVYRALRSRVLASTPCVTTSVVYLVQAGPKRCLVAAQNKRMYIGRSGTCDSHVPFSVDVRKRCCSSTSERMRCMGGRQRQKSYLLVRIEHVGSGRSDPRAGKQSFFVSLEHVISLPFTRRLFLSCRGHIAAIDSCIPRWQLNLRRGCSCQCS
jgi:hypothetical protein